MKACEGRTANRLLHTKLLAANVDLMQRSRAASATPRDVATEAEPIVAEASNVHDSDAARALADFVCEQLSDTGVDTDKTDSPPISAVRIRVGVLLGVHPAALKSAFREVTTGTALQGAALEIEPVEAIVFCPNCHQDRPLETTVRELRCPVCDSPTPRVVQGKEFEIISIDPANAPTA